MNPKVTLINPPSKVMETIWVLWECSKVDGPVELDVATVAATVPQKELEDLFWKVLAQHIPIAEHIHFTFMLEGVSVSLREQMVRHRIGTHVGDNFGVDIVPDLASSSWWSQSMRIQDMGSFADRRMYRIPETVKQHQGQASKTVDGKNAIGVFMDAMEHIQTAYNELVEAGIPMEDARELIPLGAQHRISWDLNLQSLLHILGKRGCQILQLGIWGPVILGMVKELVSKVHPMFARIVSPPCIGPDDKFKACQYQLENERRITQEDRHPPCSLWLGRDPGGAAHTRTGVGDHLVQIRRLELLETDDSVPRQAEMRSRADGYRELWHHDPYTYARVDLRADRSEE